MTATPPRVPGASPTADRRVTILAACSVLCTVIALVCLGLLVFTGDKDADATTVPSGVADSGSTGDDSPSSESSRPDNLTDVGWTDSNATCLTGDPWVYAAEGDPGQVVICVHDDLLYQATNDQTGAPEPDNFQAIGGFCPFGTNGQEMGQFNYDHGNIGWTEYNGTQRWEYDMYSGKGEQHLADPANLSESHYAAFWTNTEVDLSSLRFCTGERGSRSEHFLADYAEPESSTTVETDSPDNAGQCDLEQLQQAQADGSGYDASGMDTVYFCDGRWAFIGKDQTSFHSDVLQWTGTEWERRLPDGTETGSGRDCYDEGKLLDDAAPTDEMFIRTC